MSLCEASGVTAGSGNRAGPIPVGFNNLAEDENSESLERDEELLLEPIEDEEGEEPLRSTIRGRWDIGEQRNPTEQMTQKKWRRLICEKGKE